VDSNNRRVKLVGVSWYGAEEQDYVVAGLEIADINQIAAKIKSSGFNSVRLLWSNELYETNPVVSDKVVAANPQLKGLHAMEVFDAVVNALAAQRLFVILDNHVSTADWCCKDADGNELWYHASYPETSWIADWKGIVQRYRGQPAVVAVDLRNELRAAASWGGDPKYDWHAAAERGGNAVLSVNPNLLVMVEGIHYASDLTGVAQLPVTLSVAHRVVYSSHEYSWFRRGRNSYGQLQQQLDQAWGYIATPGRSYTAPVWVGEFGICHTSLSCVQGSTPGSQGFWYTNFLRYLKEKDTDWNYWALNGTQARGTSRTFGAEETYGVLDRTWLSPAGPTGLSVLQTLQPIIPASQGPGISPH
jgi:endoglucanase